MGDDHPVDSSLKLFGSFRIWTTIIVGSIVMLAAVGVFAWTFFVDINMVAVDATVQSKKCQPLRTTTRCTTRNDAQTCTTSSTTDCKLTVKYGAPGSNSETLTNVLTKTFEENHEPSVGDQMQIYVDKTNPQIVSTTTVTGKNKNAVRTVAAVIFAISLISVIVNTVFRRNNNFQRLQGTIGAVDVVSNAFRR